MVDEKWWIFYQGFFYQGEKNRGKYFSLFLFLSSQELACLVPLNWTHENLHLFLVKSNIDSLFSSKDWNRNMNVVTTLTLFYLIFIRKKFQTYEF